MNSRLFLLFLPQTTPEMDQNTSTPEQPVDLLTDLEQDYQYEDASTGTRFANYIIDVIAFYVFTVVLFLGIVFASQSEEFIYWVDSIPSLVDRLLSLILYGIIMSLVEGFTKGRSLGKLITGTKAIRWDNQPFSWGDAVGRGFSRMVPFEAFSALWGSPWHDKWTNTRVVRIRK
jgi:uncharacterized RDD family membrane protein YckC